MRRILHKNETEETDYFIIVKNLILAYIFTVIVLLVLAFLLYKIGLSEKTISVCVILTYAGSTFLAGFLTGRAVKKMKFIWGLAEGIAYFVVLVLLSLIGGRAGAIWGKDFVTSLLLCAGGGMLGGMLST